MALHTCVGLLGFFCEKKELNHMSTCRVDEKIMDMPPDQTEGFPLQQMPGTGCAVICTHTHT